jgi:hypothetical protein
VKHYFEYDDDLNYIRYSVHDCPFCGSKDTELYQTQVQCERCGAHGPDVAEEQWPMAITLWNDLPRKKGAQLKALRLHWSNLMRRIKRAEKKAAAERKKEPAAWKKDGAKQTRADRKWAAEREAWLRSPPEGNA